MVVITRRRPVHERVGVWLVESRSTPAFLARSAIRRLRPRPSWLNLVAAGSFVWSGWQVHPVAGGTVLGVSALVANWRMTERGR